jgi:hypothetical protein
VTSSPLLAAIRAEVASCRAAEHGTRMQLRALKRAYVVSDRAWQAAIAELETELARDVAGLRMAIRDQESARGTEVMERVR